MYILKDRNVSIKRPFLCVLPVASHEIDREYLQQFEWGGLTPGAYLVAVEFPGGNARMRVVSIRLKRRY